MPQSAAHDRLALLVRADDKALIMRAAALVETDMTKFVLRAALREAQAVVDEHEITKLTRRNSLLVLDLLENPSAPNVKLREAARTLPEMP